VSMGFRDGRRNGAIVRRAKLLGAEAGDINLVFPSLNERSDSDEIDMLQRMLGLTERQASIARCIALGKSASEIAATLGIKVHTVRDHIKAIYDRTDLNKQTDLAVLVGELKLMTAALEGARKASRSATSNVFQRMTNFFWTRDGRRICYSDCGDRDGRVILKTHSSFGGRWVWEPTAETLHRYGLRLIIIERPGVGMTDPAPEDRENICISDAISLLDHLEVEKAYGLGTSGGAFHLANLIAAYPSRFTGACFISARAFDVSGQTAEDDFVANLAALPLDAGALIMESAAGTQTDEGWRESIRLILDENKVDLTALEDSALMDMHVRQQKSVMSEGFVGQLLEWKDYGRDMVPPALPDLPYAVIVGRDDFVTHVQRGAQDWAGFLSVDPISVDGAGHLIFLTHTRDVLRATGLIAAV
ncbi:MAG: alpha/beta fold hydrolase, partial [Pseudomonadota bacterium]